MMTPVSLFTREWIEMTQLSQESIRKTSSPSLRGSGLKCWCAELQRLLTVSPSLQGSGLRACVHSKKVV